MSVKNSQYIFFLKRYDMDVLYYDIKSISILKKYLITITILYFNKITFFFLGLIHLESLELLSKQCQMKLQTVLLSYSGAQLTDIQDKLDQIKDLCYLDFEDDEKIMTIEEFKNSLITCINQISTDVKTEKILRVSSYTLINNA